MHVTTKAPCCDCNGVRQGYLGIPWSFAGFWVFCGGFAVLFRGYFHNEKQKITRHVMRDTCLLEIRLAPYRHTVTRIRYTMFLVPVPVFPNSILLLLIIVVQKRRKEFANRRDTKDGVINSQLTMNTCCFNL
jgi:hypothetical protein